MANTSELMPFRAPQHQRCMVCAERKAVRLINNAIELPNRSIRSWRLPDALRESAESECRICAAMWTGLETYTKTVHPGYQVTEMGWQSQADSRGRNPLLIWVSLMPTSEFDERPGLNLRLRMFALEDADFSNEDSPDRDSPYVDPPDDGFLEMDILEDSLSDKESPEEGSSEEYLIEEYPLYNDQLDEGSSGDDSRQEDTSEDDIPDKPWSVFGIGKPVPAYSGSETTMSSVKAWLSNCLLTHPQCQGAQNPERPACLVDIGSSNTDIKLVDAQNDVTIYLALSYCWGKTLSLTTTTDSLEARRTGIKWDDLPKTFQDAITFTRYLGYRYLWIDALCIIQDNKEDWQRESGKMASIYQNSILTISAAHAEDTMAGCFSDRYHWADDPEVGSVHSNKLENDTISFDCEQATGTMRTIYVSRAFEHETMSRAVEKASPLFQRAWALQERLLSPRTLQLTRSEASWECRTLLDCECGGIKQTSKEFLRVDNNQYFYGGVSADLRSGAKMLGDAQGEPIPPGWASRDRLKVFKSWYFLVEEYMHRKLTYSSDKLPAFSGIAHQLQRPSFGGYYAGMWAAELPLALLWRRLSSRSHTVEYHTPKEYRAPSWSWASVDGPIRFVETLVSPDEAHIQAQVEDVNCTLLGHDKMGEVSSGYIKLTAPVNRCRWEVREGGEHKRTGLNIDSLDQTVWCHVGPHTNEQDDADCTVYFSASDQERLHKINFPENFYLLLILSSGPRDIDYFTQTSKITEDVKFLGILLVESKREKNSYERCGYFTLETGWLDATPSDWIAAIARKAKIATVKIT